MYRWNLLNSYLKYFVKSHSVLPNFPYILSRQFSKWDDEEEEFASSNLWGRVIPNYAQVVICGAGPVGNSVAYHLAKQGWTNIVVLEQGRIGFSSSSLGSNVISPFISSPEGVITQYTTALYKELESQGSDIGWKSCGAVDVARTKERLIYFQRLADVAKVYGLDYKIVGPQEIKNLHPLIKTDDIECENAGQVSWCIAQCCVGLKIGGLWKQEDGLVDPLKVCSVLAKLAQKEGVQYFEECQVHRILTEDGKVSGIQTNHGIVQCEYLVVCTGTSLRDLGQKCSPPFRVPAHSAEIPFIVTRPVPGVNPSLPIIRDYDGKLFCHEHNQRLLIGGYHNGVKLITSKGTSSNLGQQNQHSENLTEFMPLYDEAKRRLPVLSQVEIEQMVKVVNPFTPDGKWIGGETPEINNLFVAGGMNGNSVQGAAGLGKALATWIENKEPDSFMLPFDVRRFIELHNNFRFLQERVLEAVDYGYAIPHPLQTEFSTARKLRCSPLYTVQDNAGAIFGERMGFERALYFDPTKSREERMCPPSTSFGQPPWFDIIRDEYIACRERVGLIDMSSFTKSFIKSAGREVVDFLQLLCSNDIDVPVGYIIQTGMQNERGGYENDCLLVRRAENCYFMMSPTSQQTRISEWIEKHIPADGSISFSDVTSMYTVLNVVGPKSKELMVELTKTDMSIPSFTCKEMNVGYASEVMVMGFNNTGEPGYSLYIPCEYALHVYNRLSTVGRDFGLKNVGYYTLRFLRIEKAIPFWGEELDSNTTPLEVGRSFKVKMQKDYFLGKFALQTQLEKGLTRRLVHFQFENHNPKSDLWPWGREPIFRNDEYVGMTTSSGYGFTLGHVVCLGFVHNFDRSTKEQKVVTTDYITKDAKFEISIGGKRFSVKPSLHPPKIPVVTMSDTMRYTPRARVGT